MPLILLAKMRLDREGRSSAGEVKKQFQRGILNLKMALEILKNQQEGTFEHDVYLGAKDSLPQLQNFVSSQLWYDDMKLTYLSQSHKESFLFMISKFIMKKIPNLL